MMKNLGKLENWTKLDLARVIIQALYNLDEPPKPTNIHVKRAQRHNKPWLIHQAEWAIEILYNRETRKGELP